MNDCPACTQARINSWCGMYRADCLDCSARALSQSPAYHDSAQADAITPRYRDALVATFGEGWKEGHEMVKQWAEAKC